MVHEVTGTEDFRQQLSTPNKLCVVDFTATWCGPCKRVAPAFESLCHKYPDVTFIKVVESNCQDLIMQLGIRAFPTFRFYLGGSQVDEVQGANIAEVENKVLQHRPQQSFSGEGHSLGGGGSTMSPEQARAARLAKLGQPNAASAPAPAPAAAQGGAPPPVVPSADDAALIQAMAAAIASQVQTPRRNDPMLLESLLEMGFPEIRAKKAVNNNTNLESAINWLEQHENDPDIDDPIPDEEIVSKEAASEEAPPQAMDTEPTSDAGEQTPADGMAQSLKCGDCGALLRDMVAAELHASKTGHMNFEECTEALKPLTPEEKAAKIEQLKQKIAERRAEREEGEKKDGIEREKQRRFMGKEMAKTREELERQTRKREAEMRKKEKMAEKAERERLKKLIEQDKRERAANKGKLSGKLGVEGYNPAMPSANTPYGATEGDAEPEEKSQEAKKEDLSPEEKIDKAIATVSRYRTGGDGGVALKTLKAYTTNALKPDDKFRSINMENNAFKSRVKPFVGGVALLKALGFVKNEENNTLFLSEEMKNEELLRETVAKLEQAHAAYVARNG